MPIPNPEPGLVVPKNDPTTATRRFVKGDRVKLSAKASEFYRNSPSPWSQLRMPPDRSGTVAHNSREENGVAVLWDGTKTPQYISGDLLERSDD